MSSMITDYPGVEITPDEARSGAYLTNEYQADLAYAWSSGVAMGRFLDGLLRKEIWGRRCDRCKRVLVPPRMYCELCYRPNDAWVRLKDTGRVVTYSIAHVNADASRRSEPILVAVIEIDGASPMHGFLHLMGEVEPGEIKIGMKVEAVWKQDGERRGAITDIRYFKPVGVG